MRLEDIDEAWRQRERLARLCAMLGELGDGSTLKVLVGQGEIVLTPAARAGFTRSIRADLERDIEEAGQTLRSLGISLPGDPEEPSDPSPAAPAARAASC